MDKMTFASYKFKLSDVIEGLNRYFTETKAFRYLRVPLEIKNGVWTSNPDYRKDIVFTNSPPDRHTRSGHVCWKYYLVCDPEEVVGVAINWLREEHDIFYTPGMEAPREDCDIFCMENLKETNNFSITIDDFYVDDAAKDYEKQTRKDLKEALQRRLYEAKRRIVGLEQGHAEKTKIIDQQKKKIDSYEATLSKITDIMKPEYAGPAWSETWDDLVERIKRLKEKVGMLEAAKTDWRDSFTKAQDSRSAFCKKLKEELNVDYRYPGSFPKMEEDILWEIKRLKTEHDDVRGLSQKVERMEQKLIEIQDICER